HREGQVREPGEQPAQRDLRLQVRDVLAEATVDALAEPEVALTAHGQPVDDQLLRLRELPRVTVRGHDQWHDGHSPRDHGAADLDVLGGEARLPELDRPEAL